MIPWIDGAMDFTRRIPSMPSSPGSPMSISRISAAAPDILLMDIGLPGLDGIEGIRRVKSMAPSIQGIMLTVFDDSEKIFQAIFAGASGYLLKSAENGRT